MSVTQVSTLVPYFNLEVRSLDGTSVQRFQVSGEDKKQPTEIHYVQLDLTPIQEGYKNLANQIDQFIRTNIISMIGALIETTKSQKKDCVQKNPGTLVTIKARFVEKKIQVLVREVRKANASEIVYKVALLAGPRLLNQPPGNIFAYVKIPKLKELRTRIKGCEYIMQTPCAMEKTQEEIADFQRQMQQARDEYAARVEWLFKEEKISHIVPDAVKSCVIASFKDPTRPKGLISEFIARNYDYKVFPPFVQLDCEKLKRNLRLAIRLCQDLAQMHKAGYVHMHLDVLNLLFEKQQSSIRIRLINLQNCVQIGTSTLYKGWNYSFLPEIQFVDPDSNQESPPIIATPSMDAYALPFIINRLVYDPNKACSPLDIRSLYQSYAPKPTPWEELKAFVHKKQGTYPQIDEVFCHLWDQNPTTRWTLKQAETALQNISDDTQLFVDNNDP